MNQFLLALQEKTKNEFPLYQEKFIEMCNEGRNQREVYDILSSFFNIRSYCHNFDFKKADYFNFMFAIRKGTFLKHKFNDENSINIMYKCMVYQDEQSIIFKPTNFEESRVIGEPICCFSNNKNYWDEHYNLENEAIYFVYEVMQMEPDNFVAITVRPNGRALVLNSAHEWSNKLGSIRFIQALGQGANMIVSKTGNPIKLTENYNQINCNRNMKNKKVVRLTESQLHNIIVESVSKILKEDSHPYEKEIEQARSVFNDIAKSAYGKDNPQLYEACVDALRSMDKVNYIMCKDGFKAHVV